MAKNKQDMSTPELIEHSSRLAQDLGWRKGFWVGLIVGSVVSIIVAS